MHTTLSTRDIVDKNQAMRHYVDATFLSHAIVACDLSPPHHIFFVSPNLGLVEQNLLLRV